jgi:hypothetical protein
MPLVILPDYPGTIEYLIECFPRWHYINQVADQFIYGGLQEIQVDLYIGVV